MKECSCKNACSFKKAHFQKGSSLRKEKTFEKKDRKTACPCENSPSENGGR
jgi:hypothetical protein